MIGQAKFCQFLLIWNWIQFSTSADPTCNSFSQCQISNTEQVINFDNYLTLNRVYPDQTKLEIIDSIIEKLPFNLLTTWPNLNTFIVDRCGLKQLDPVIFGGSVTANETKLLIKLSLNGNRLTELLDLSFAAAVNLEELFLSKNRISKITGHAFSNLLKLKELHLVGNFLTTLENDKFNELNSLSSLHLDENQLIKMDFGIFQLNHQLVTIDLSRNQIAEITAVANSVTEYLYLSHNTLTDVCAVTMFSSLKGLHLNDNRKLNYSTLSLLNSAQTLNLLDLSETDMDRLENNYSFLDGLNNLNRLLMDYNALNNLNLDHFPVLKNMEELSLESNSLTEIKQFDQLRVKFPKLQSLRTYGNHWTCKFLNEMTTEVNIFEHDSCKLNDQPEQQKKKIGFWLLLASAVIILIAVGLSMVLKIKKQRAAVSPEADLLTVFMVPNNIMENSASAEDVDVQLVNTHRKKSYRRFESTMQEMAPICHDDDVTTEPELMCE